MSDAVEALLLDLVGWIAAGDRSYVDVMAAWRTSCPRLPVWEEATARGLVTRDHAPDGSPIVRITELGRSYLAQRAASVR